MSEAGPESTERRAVRLARASARIENSLSGLLLRLGVAAIYGMLLVVVANAISRQLLGAPLRGAFEISQLMMPVVVFGGMAWTFTRIGHFRMTAIVERLGVRSARVVARLQIVIAAALFLLLARLQYVYAATSWQRREFIPGIVPVPVYPTKIAIALGCGVVAVSLVVWLFLGNEMGQSDDPEVD